MRTNVDIINEEKTWIFDHAPLGVLVELFKERGISIPLDKVKDRSYLTFWVEQAVEPYVHEPSPTDTYQYYAPAYIAKMHERWKVKEWENYD